MRFFKLQSDSCKWIVVLGVAALLCAPEVIAQNTHPRLLPQPMHVEYAAGSLRLKDLCIHHSASPAPEDVFAMDTLQQGIHALDCKTTQGLPISLERTGPVAPLPVSNETPGPDSREAYTINIDRKSVV